jgi:hypothetical protein
VRGGRAKVNGGWVGVRFGRVSSISERRRDSTSTKLGLEPSFVDRAPAGGSTSTKLGLEASFVDRAACGQVDIDETRPGTPPYPASR